MRHSGRQTDVGKSMRCVALRCVARVFVRGRHVCRPADRFWLCVVRAVCGTVGVVSVVWCVTHIYMHKAGAGVCCVCVHVRVYVCVQVRVYVCTCVGVLSVRVCVLIQVSVALSSRPDSQILSNHSVRVCV